MFSLYPKPYTPRQRSCRKLCLYPKRGFTLIELLIAVAIIAILAMVGMVIFTKSLSNTRDVKRKADIDAIAKALQTNYTTTAYSPLAASQFSTGSIPSSDSQGHPYCGNSTLNTQPADPSPWTSSCPTNYAQVSTSVPASGTSWKICASLENGGSPSIYCQTSVP